VSFASFVQVPALLAVGLEGCWGLLLCCFVLPLTTLVKGSDGFPLDDAVAAARSILSNWELGVAVYSSILSIAFFNFFGVSGKQEEAPAEECRPNVVLSGVQARPANAGTSVGLAQLCHSAPYHTSPAMISGFYVCHANTVSVAAVSAAYHCLLCYVQ
jgi:hypothetical protein